MEFIALLSSGKELGANFGLIKYGGQGKEIIYWVTIVQNNYMRQAF
jgi:hypothetical protein